MTVTPQDRERAQRFLPGASQEYHDRLAELLAAVRKETDAQWYDNAVALCSAAGSWEVNGFMLALKVRIEAIRAGVGGGTGERGPT